MATPMQQQPSDRALPDWHRRHIPRWRELLAPMLAQQATTPLHILEIGSYAGHSSAWIVNELLGHHESALVCVDTWSAEATNPSLVATIARAWDEFQERIAATGRRGQVVVRQGTSAQVLPQLLAGGARFDLVYVDGSHEAADVLLDSVLALEMLSRGGVLVWDDYTWRGGDGVHAPRMAIDAVLDSYGERLRVLHRGVQVAVEVTP